MSKMVEHAIENIKYEGNYQDGFNEGEFIGNIKGLYKGKLIAKTEIIKKLYAAKELDFTNDNSDQIILKIMNFIFVDLNVN